MKRNETLRLVKLYLSFHLNKMFCIILGLVIFIWMAVLVLNSNIPFTKEEYFTSYIMFHEHYLTQSLFFMQIINSAILAFLIGAEMNSFALFDPMFVVQTKRSKIVFAKLLSNLLLLLGLVIYECLTLILIGYIVFPKWNFTFSLFSLIPYEMVSLMQFLFLGEMIALIFSSYFIPILIFIINFAVLILLQNSKDISKISYYLVAIEIKNNEPILMWNAYIYSAINIVLFMGILLLFQRKDISNT